MFQHGEGCIKLRVTLATISFLVCCGQKFSCNFKHQIKDCKWKMKACKYFTFYVDFDELN